MPKLNGEEVEVIDRKLSRQKRCCGFAEIELLKADLDGDFPASGDAYEFVIVWILDQSFGVCAQKCVGIQEPQQRVRIEKEVHSMYSLKSANGASKSAARWILPFALPALQGHDPRSAFFTWANG